MSKIVEITYSESKTWQEEAYSPRNVHVSAKMELPEGEDVQSGYAELKRQVKKALNQELPKKAVDITKTNDIPWDYNK